ncbi:hypothetical protein BGZ97_002861 [Linnemannia gamsii]|uniref:TspO/MBR-related protein n=1 Tax=Linnemannia gamsii TaxID=64522 RepID=A0A9P6UGZ5_9FUNG|nr:hypothetical protein BGZ97_002861 [Linnemannia gamsii]
MPTEHLQHVCQSVNTNLARYPIVAVGLPLVGGFLTAIPSHLAVKSYYETLRKPEWAAPACVFAPVWAGLCITVGYASHLVALRTGPNTVPSIRDLARTGLGIYGLNLALNLAWSPLIWKQKIGAALVTAGGLTASSVAVAYYFFKVDKCAGYLTIPYVAWLGGPACDSARKVGKEINDAAKHAKHEIKDAAHKAADKVEKEFK